MTKRKRNRERDRERDRKKFEEDYKPAYDAFIALYPFTLENLPGEIWLPIPDYEDYHCSNFGRVKSFCRKEPKILKPKLHQCGYLGRALCKNGKMKHFNVHILVAKLFIPNPLNLPEVDHVYGNKLDCSVFNLRWVTQAENTKYAFEYGLINVPKGEDRSDSKLTNEQVLYIRENPDGLTGRQLAEKFHVNQQTISDIQRGLKWKNVGGKIRKTIRPRIPDEIRAKIRAEYKAGGITQLELAKKYGVDPKTVWIIIHEQSAE